MKQVSFDKTKLLKGLNICADAVALTIGPKGHNVYFETDLGYESTNDGATIADKIVLKNKQQDAGAWVIRNITAKQNDEVGDGTTTVAVLTQALIREILKRPENPMLIMEFLNSALSKALELLKQKTRKLEVNDIERVALISSENKEIAHLIAEIFNKLGEKAVINVEDSKTFLTDYEIIDGFEANAGFLSPHFINDKKSGKAIYENIPVLVTENKISNISDVHEFQEILKEKKIAQCVIVCDDIDDSMLGVYVNSKNMGLFQSLVIKASGETLKDIEGVTGATRISNSTGKSFHNIKYEDFGFAQKVIADANKTLFLGNSKASKEYANLIEQFTQNETNQYIDKKNKERIARLRAGIASLRIASPTDLQRIYLRRKAEDAVKAVAAAIEEGICEGGGITLWRIASELSAEDIGQRILKTVLIEPIKRIIDNAGLDYSDIMINKPLDLGFDAKSSKYVSMMDEGIIDPVKVIRCALINAVSAASIFCTTKCVITDYENR
jgi:chaperonin GroEL